jgi:quercetin dioxygenase-like cupin family protein
LNGLIDSVIRRGSPAITIQNDITASARRARSHRAVGPPDPCSWSFGFDRVGRVSRAVKADVLRLPGGVEAGIHVRGSETGNAFALLTDVCPPGWTLPRHRHAREAETIHITAGALWLEVDGQRREMHPGDTAIIPSGTLHSGGTLSVEPVRRVLVFSPAGMEQFFERLA